MNMRTRRHHEFVHSHSHARVRVRAAIREATFSEHNYEPIVLDTLRIL